MSTTTENVPSYDDAASTLTKVPSYTDAPVTAFPSYLPCSLTIKNLDRLRDPIQFLDNSNGDKIVYELPSLIYSPAGSADETLCRTLLAPGGYASPAKVLVAAGGQCPYAMRKHVATSTYEIIELHKDGSFGNVTKIQTKGMFKNKYYLESANGKPEHANMYIKGSFKALNASLRQLVDGQKTTLVEVIKGVTSTQAHFSNTSEAGVATPFIVAAMFAALDSHKEHYLTFTTDEKLDEHQARVRPSAWDTRILQAGQTSKKQKEFSQQLESERQREYQESVNRGSSRNGIIPAQRSESSSRSQSKSRSQSRTASPATFARSPLPADHEGNEQRGRQ